MVASFAGDVDYLSSGDTKSFSITPEETTMTYTGPTVILARDPAARPSPRRSSRTARTTTTATAAQPRPIPAETVTLSLGSQSCTGTTTSTGNVSCTIPSVTVPLGPRDGRRRASPATPSTRRRAPARPRSCSRSRARGVFTLGDVTANAALPPSTPTVTWWGNTWYKLNVLTGGSAPSAFKGFAGARSRCRPRRRPRFCASDWTSSGGNSPPPPSSVPSYMGVIVSRSSQSPAARSSAATSTSSSSRRTPATHRARPTQGRARSSRRSAS